MTGSFTVSRLTVPWCADSRTSSTPSLLDSLTGSLNGAGFPSGPALTPACGAGARFSPLHDVISAVIDTTNRRATGRTDRLRMRRIAVPISQVAE